jgi:hypothetical protein
MLCLSSLVCCLTTTSTKTNQRTYSTIDVECWCYPVPRLANTRMVGTHYTKPTHRVRVCSAKVAPMQRRGTGHSVRVINTLGRLHD